LVEEGECLSSSGKPSSHKSITDLGDVKSLEGVSLTRFTLGSNDDDSLLLLSRVAVVDVVVSIALQVEQRELFASDTKRQQQVAQDRILRTIFGIVTQTLENQRHGT
jgi:hypothetical protein